MSQNGQELDLTVIEINHPDLGDPGPVGRDKVNQAKSE